MTPICPANITTAILADLDRHYPYGYLPLTPAGKRLTSTYIEPIPSGWRVIASGHRHLYDHQGLPIVVDCSRGGAPRWRLTRAPTPV